MLKKLHEIKKNQPRIENDYKAGAYCQAMSHPMALRTHLARQVHDSLQQGVSCGDCLGACLETALGYDHVGKLLCKVNVGHFQRTSQEGALASDAGGSDVGHTGGPRKCGSQG